jgi:hypothetical protein
VSKGTQYSLGRRRLLRYAGASLIFSVSPLAGAAAKLPSVLAVRIWPAADYTRVTLEHDAPLKYTHFTVENPDRLVVDIEGVEFNSVLDSLARKVATDDPYIKLLRAGRFKPGVTPNPKPQPRAISPTKHFIMLKPDLNEIKDDFPSAPYNLFMTNFSEKFKSTLYMLVPGNQNLSIDLILSKQLEPIFYNSRFKDEFKNGRIKVSFFETLTVENYDLENVKSIVVMVSNQENTLQLYLDFLNRFASRLKDSSVHVSFLVYPFCSAFAENRIRELANETLRALIKKTQFVESFNYDFYPLDFDLFSLEYPEALTEMLFSHDKSGLTLCAEAVFKWQILYGRFSKMFYWGRTARNILDLHSEIEQENNSFSSHFSTDFPYLVVVDRTVDLTTPLLTQFSYLGFLDEFFGINKGAVRVPKSILDPKTTNDDLTYYRLMSDGLILPKLENETYSVIVKVIKETVQEIERIKPIQDLAKDLEIATQNIEYMKKKMELEVHLRLLERIRTELFSVTNVEFTFIQDSILRGEKESFDALIAFVQIRPTRKTVLRLIVLFSFCFGGFTQVEHLVLTREFMHAFGLSSSWDLLRLETAGLVVVKGDPGANRVLLEANNYDGFKRIVDQNPFSETNAKKEEIEFLQRVQYAELFHSNVPIMCYRIHEFLLESNPASPIKEYLATEQKEQPSSAQSDPKSVKQAVGQTSSASKFPMIEQRKRKGEDQPSGKVSESVDGNTKPSFSQKDKSKKDMKPTHKADFVVFVVGGLTYSEVCSFRKIEKQMDRKIVLLTTHILKSEGVFSEFD